MATTYDNSIDNVLVDLGIVGADDVLKGTINRYILGVKSYLSNSGASDFSSGAAYSCLLQGVIDMWNLGAGEGKFSQLFINLANQLRAG